MDRYQFDGYISDFIENKLSIAKRREFEQFLADNSDAKEQVSAVRSTIRQLHRLPKIQASAAFADKLHLRLASESAAMPLPMDKRKPLIFGFTPLSAGMMSAVLLAIVFVGYELMPINSSNPLAIPPPITTTNVMPLNSQPQASPQMQMAAQPNIAEAREDSTLTEEDLPGVSPEIESQINYVGSR